MLYNRQKILLALLELFNRQLSAIQIQKYLFLFTRKQDIKAFDFVPYQYGCFSFQANQDIVTLTKNGYITKSENYCQLNQKQSGSYLMALDMFDQATLHDIKDNYGELTQDELICYTYKVFPFYAIKSTIADKLLSPEELQAVEKQKRHFDTPQLFTIGYEGISLEEYVKRLIINDVHILCDVRKNAYSQKYGFSKAILQKACEGVGVKYIHVPQLGIESNKRQDLCSQKDYDILFDEYERTTLKQNHEVLLFVRNLIDSDKRVALTCFEKDPKQCHRSRVAKALLALPNARYTLKLLI
ncbi:MAG: DUF488 family protein [Paludibacteraceae bacterium]|nr:DUF488 family protein [Paludibacteraceae bacterium]